MGFEFGLFAELSILVAIAAAVSFLMHVLKQPLVIGYIIAGLIVGPIFGIARSDEILHLFSEIGIAILLFTVGLNLNPKVIRQFGKIAIITGVGQVLFTTLAGYFVADALGFGLVPSLYIGIALAFSSTIIIMKLISDKGDIDRLYAKISIGFLLIQDLVAVLLLFGIPLSASGEGSLETIGIVFLRGVLLAGGIFAISVYLLPRLNRYVSGSRELLFLFALAWGIGIAALFKGIGFSLESGALFAGVALASLPSRHEINARLTPLRDFFIVLFFILLGSQMTFGSIGQLIIPTVIFSLLVLIGNPLILMAIMGLLGYRKRTGFQTGLTVAQISEFSLILIALGVKLGHLDSQTLSLVTLVGLTTIFVSTYLILYSDKIYGFIAPYLSVFERKNIREKEEEMLDPELILFGYNRIGYDFLEMFKRSEKEFMIIDYDPEVIDDLDKKSIPNKYGDAGDPDFLESLSLNNVSLAVSTVPETEANTVLIRHLRRVSLKCIIMVVAHRIEDAFELYDEGADYVIMPHFLGGKQAAQIAEELESNHNGFKALRDEHLTYLSSRASIGHEHPEPERTRNHGK